MPDQPALDALLQKARRRVLWQLVVDKGALALTIAMAGAVLLLLIGTQILDWYWPVLLALAGLGAGLYQLRGKVPSLYRVAQKIDRRLMLADTLSTALHFARNDEPARAAICKLQRRAAESTAATVDLGAALPYQRSRYLIPASALAAAAMVLFGVRYAATGSLDLNRPLLALAVDSFFGPNPEVAKNDVRKGKIEPQAFDPGQPDQKSTTDEELPESMLEPPDSQQNNGQTSGKDSTDATDAKQQDKGDEKGDSGKDSPSSDSQEGKDSEQNQDGKQGGKPKNESGMLDKLRDALANMLNPNKSDAAKQQQSQQNSQKSQSQKSDADKQNSNPGDSSSSESGQQQDQNAKEQGDSKGGDSPGKPADDASSSQGDKVGDKTLKDAKMLEAMGKISELLGKRSQNVQGEMMVEVGQTKQQLKTQWSSKTASHSDAGGEIHRDEVPLMYQEYVEQYFEEIRKNQGSTAAAKNPAAAAAKSKATPNK